MSGWGLINSVCDFRVFVNLEELNLSHNRVSDISTMGLEELKHLRVLDVSFNDINTPIREVSIPFNLHPYIVLFIASTTIPKSFHPCLSSI